MRIAVRRRRAGARARRIAALGVEPSPTSTSALQRDVDEPRGREPRRDVELDASVEGDAREPPPLG
jgi:hypothetical protein